jgi:hypothetical protein
MLKVVNMPNQDSQGQSATSPGGPAGDPSPPAAAAPTPAPASASAPQAPPATTHSAWQERLSRLAGWLGGYLRSPRTRLGVVGVILLLAGVVWITNSVWTLPLIVVGIIMVVIAWVGSRLDGRFAIEWGHGGTQVEFRAQIKAPPPVTQPVRLSPIPSSSRPAHLRTPARSEFDDGDVIEGEGHTVEIDVAELKTLIRAAEAREGARDGNAEHPGAERGASPDPSQRRPAA